mmetsp:Transcript_82208/g.207468  ORF Transcript_82208/g.207468 Transcript_82208/m.207468 type:complete len:100 (-) Transcript_82208:23-322(-)
MLYKLTHTVSVRPSIYWSADILDPEVLCACGTPECKKKMCLATPRMALGTRKWEMHIVTSLLRSAHLHAAEEASVSFVRTALLLSSDGLLQQAHKLFRP